MSTANLRQKIIRTLKSIYDPELPVDIYELGLIYAINLDIPGKVHILMTVTSPNCPVAEELPKEIKRKLEELPEIEEAEIKLDLELSYSFDRLSPEAKLALGI